MDNSILEKTLEFEGGFVDDPDDKGGATNYGITEDVAREHGYEGDMKDLPKSKAVEIYKESYVDPLLDDIDSKVIQLLVFDASVNHGTKWGIKFLQRAYNTLNFDPIAEDGVLGSQTVGAVNKYDDTQSLAFWCLIVRGQYFRDIVKKSQSQKRFIKGWGNRLKHLMKEVL